MVATNPPYMGSKNMGSVLREYVEQRYFWVGAISTAFILCCIRLSQSAGRVAMVAQKSWIFLSSYAQLRACDEKASEDIERTMSTQFRGVLRETGLEAIAHLGRYAFSEIGNAAVAP